jgi:hypothetical protein
MQKLKAHVTGVPGGSRMKRAARFTTLMTASVLILCFSASLCAQWSPLSPLSGGGAVGSPGGTHPIVANADTLHFVWMSGGEIFYRRSTDAGVNWGHRIPVVSSGTAEYPCSLEVSGSTLHLFWPDARGGTWEVFYKRSTDDGNTWGPETPLTRTANLFRMGTAISGSALHVVWGGTNRTDGLGDSSAIYYLHSTTGGVTWEPIVQLAASSSGERPAVAAFSNFVHVTWFDKRDATQSWDTEIYYKRSTDGGATWGPDVRMSHTPTHTRHPQIVATPGVVCCIWEDGQIFKDGKAEGDPALYTAVSADNGQTWSTPQRITFVNAPNGWATHSKSYAYGSTVHLAWTDGPNGPNQTRATYYMTSMDGGRTWSAPERLTLTSEGEWWASAVAGSDTYAVALMLAKDTISYRRRSFTASYPKTDKSR